MSSSTFFHLLYGAVIVLGTLAVMTFVSLGPRAELGPLLLAGGLSAAFLAVFAFAAWRDPVTLARPFIVVGLFGTLMSLVGVANGQRLSEIPAFWLSLGILVLSTTAYVWIPLSRGRLRHVLLGEPGPVYEYDGLHFRIVVGPAARPGGTLPVDLWVENCWTGLRVLELRGRWPRGQAPGVRVAIEPEACLRTRLELPVPRKAEGWIQLPLDLEVRGVRGRRLKPRRARMVRNKVTGVEQLAELAMGSFSRGGGLRFPVQIVEDQAATG